MTRKNVHLHCTANIEAAHSLVEDSKRQQKSSDDMTLNSVLSQGVPNQLLCQNYSLLAFRSIATSLAIRHNAA